MFKKFITFIFLTLIFNSANKVNADLPKNMQKPWSKEQVEFFVYGGSFGTGFLLCQWFVLGKFTSEDVINISKGYLLGAEQVSKRRFDIQKFAYNQGVLSVINSDPVFKECENFIFD